MDPIIAAITAAISIGAINGLTETSKTAITDAYDKIKSLLTKKFGSHSDVVQAVHRLEQQPAQIGQAIATPDALQAIKTDQKQLEDALKHTNASQDQELLREVQAMINTAKHSENNYALTNTGITRERLDEMSHRLTLALTIEIHVHTDTYMIARGPEAHRSYTSAPGGQWDTTISGKETIENLRVKLLRGAELKEPTLITVTGTLFPCALLASGWWDRNTKTNVQHKWRNEVQEWLFHGFDLWGPSWDFTWDLDHWDQSQQRDYFIAQLGDGDEANSLPVLIPHSKAKRLRERLHKWGGLEAEVTCILGHRSHFHGQLDPALLKLFGGLLDYCLWIDEGNPKHRIQPLNKRTDVYSGYLWKCVASKRWMTEDSPGLDDVYFVWEHANFASTEAVAYSLEALEHKEAYIKKKYSDDLLLIQKSSSLVPGEPIWTPEEIYPMFLGEAGPPI